MNFNRIINFNLKLEISGNKPGSELGSAPLWALTMTKLALNLPISSLEENFGFKDLQAGQEALWMITWN